MSNRPSFRVYHKPDCAETTQFLDLLGQWNLEYETTVVGTDISESQFEILMGEDAVKGCPRVLMCNNHNEDRLRFASGKEWTNMGSVEDTTKFLKYANNLDSFN